MRSLHGVVGIAAVIAKLRTTVVVNAHPGCFTATEVPDEDAILVFCDPQPSGACCTESQEDHVIGLYNKEAPLSEQCAWYYKQVRGLSSFAERILLLCSSSAIVCSCRTLTD